MFLIFKKKKTTNKTEKNRDIVCKEPREKTEPKDGGELGRARKTRP